MKYLLPLFLILVPSQAIASAPPDDSQQQEKAAVHSVNTHCPIRGGKVDGKTFVTYDGNKIGFCCPGCDSKFLSWTKEKKDDFVKKSLAEQGGAGEKPAAERAAEPYPLVNCPVSGEPLGSMGDPIVLQAEGREIRLCCKGCIDDFNENAAKYVKAVNQEIADQQRPHYPVDSCLISGEPLVEEGKDVAIEVVIKNRLFRLCCKSCVKDLKKDPEPFFVALDKAVVEAQSEQYPLKNCLVREKSELGSMGDPVEKVVGNRLLRFCCKKCIAKFDKAPLPYLHKLDAAWAPIHAARKEAKATHGEAHEHAHSEG